MKHLYELSDQMKGLQEMIAGSDMDPEIFHDTMEGLTGDIIAKGASTLLVMANLGSDIDAYDREIKRMQARKKTIATNLEWLKNYLRDNMMASGIEKIESPVFTATLIKAKKVAQVDDIDKIRPMFFKRIPASRQLVKADLLAALKAGKKCPGATLVDGKRGLTIR